MYNIKELSLQLLLIVLSLVGIFIVNQLFTNILMYYYLDNFSHLSFFQMYRELGGVFLSSIRIIILGGIVLIIGEVLKYIFKYIEYRKISLLLVSLIFLANVIFYIFTILFGIENIAWYHKVILSIFTLGYNMGMLISIFLYVEKVPNKKKILKDIKSSLINGDYGNVINLGYGDVKNMIDKMEGNELLDYSVMMGGAFQERGDLKTANTFFDIYIDKLGITKANLPKDWKLGIAEYEVFLLVGKLQEYGITYKAQYS